MSTINVRKIISQYITSPLDFDDKYFTQFIVSSSEYVSPRLICDYFYDGSTYNLNINSAKIIDTIKGTSIEGQHLTGKKLTVIGTIDVNIIFKCKENAKDCYILDKNIPFSSFIIIPDNICEYEEINIQYQVEDIEVVDICENKLFISIILLLKYDDIS